jgi:hypothetical protein
MVLPSTGWQPKALAIITATIALGFLTIYAFGWRKHGIETGGKPIYWNNMRPVHGLLYAVVAYSVWNGYRKSATTLLLVDVLIGIAVYLNK